MATGDHLRVKRRLYWHHGIDLGDGTVVHASGEPGRMKLDAEIRRSASADFTRGGVAVVTNAEYRLPCEEITANALSALGGRDYSLLFNNCEHFARWCETGEAASRQVDSFAIAGAALGFGTRIALGVAGRSVGGTLAMRLIPGAAPLSIALGLAGTALALQSRWRDRGPSEVRRG